MKNVLYIRGYVQTDNTNFTVTATSDGAKWEFVFSSASSAGEAKALLLLFIALYLSV